MTDLEDRLRALADAPVPGPSSPAQLRHRSRRRTTRRRALAVGLPLALVALVAAAVLARPAEPDGTVNAGPGPGPGAGTTASTSPGTSTTAVPPTTTPVEPDSSTVRFIGDLDGMEVTITPTSDLADGDLIEVAVTEAQLLPDAQVFFCAGDVTEDTALSACDFSPNGDPLAVEEGPGQATVGRTTATARRILLLARDPTDPNGHVRYDCATEPAGCVLVVAPITTPIRAALVPVTFADEPLGEPSLMLDRTDGLRDGDEVAVTAEGLRPNVGYDARMCGPAPSGGGRSCDGLGGWQDVAADGDGRLTTRAAVAAGFYSWQGRTDCTEGGCSLSLLDVGGEVVADQAVTFAPDVRFPEPALAVDPAGPFTEGQVVTLSGTGFPPGLDLADDFTLGICPADKDPAVEERCGYPVLTDAGSGPGQTSVVADDGTFAVELELTREPCAGPAGCVLSWVLNHGPAAVSLPVTIDP